jgi:hypothetical protein
MVNYCFALPVLPGEVEGVKKFSEQNTNTEEHDEFYKIAGVTREHAWLQRSPNPELIDRMLAAIAVAYLRIVGADSKRAPFQEFEHI